MSSSAKEQELKESNVSEIETLNNKNDSSNKECNIFYF
jgi:hypothetical protein